MTPPKDIRQKLLATFQIEHRDHVEQMRSLLAMIEKTSGQPASAELDEAFRRAHSLKGAARAVELRPVEGLAHRLETLFSRVRQGALPFDEKVAGVVSRALDASEDCVTALGDNRPTPDFGPALDAIERVLGMEPEASGRPGPEPAAPTPAFQPLETVRVTVQNFDGLLRSAGGLLAESQRQNHVTAQLNGIARQIAGMEKEAEYVRRSAAGSLRRGHGHTRVSAFLDSMESQTRTLARQTNEVRRLHQRSSWTMTRLGKQLQSDVWQARMVPADSLLEGFRKMMRDLARDESKEIDFRVTNTGVHADRRVLDLLKDPVMHLLRNALSHGIEPPRERVAKGKPGAGLVALRVGTDGQRLTITIEDDGRGVDLARVAEVAVRQGILSDADASRSSPRELGRILFRPGFSTSRVVTDLSGRGMGLSVVQEAVRRLQGNIDIDARDGCGTVVHLSVPLSIATHRLLLVGCGSQLFAVPIQGIERLFRTKLQGLETVEGKPVLLLDGQTVPLLSLQHLLGMDRSSTTIEPGVLKVIVLHSRGRKAAIAVEKFLYECEAVIQDLGPAAGHNGKISGGIVLEDGGIAFVLNLTDLLETQAHPESPSGFLPSEPVREKAPPSILVVDDSLTTRTLEKSILEANGFRVQVAVDGLEALGKLRAEKPDLVITDIQMPRMDGFALLEAMKKDSSLHRIPVIVVTSLDRREDQKRGLELGADAYIVKRKFDQQELLAAIRQIL
jgi:two-component system, chemotaxis family, sensor kinase CheA